MAQTCSSTAGSTLAKVPTAPETAPVAISPRAVRSRVRFRSISAWKRAKVSPIVVGSAWMPCERPMRSVSLCSNARRFSAAISAATSAIRMSAARTSCTLNVVSSTSEEVIP